MGMKQKLYDLRQESRDRRTPKVQSEKGKFAVVCLSGIKAGDSGEFGQVLADYTVVPSLACIREEDYSKVEVYLGSPPKGKLDALRGLKWIQLSSAGMNGYDNMRLYNGKPLVTNARGIYGIPISEFVIGAALMMNKPGLSNKLSRRSLMIDPSGGYGFTGAVVAICGLGDIGRNIAARCRGMQCKKVVGFDKVLDAAGVEVDEIRPLSELSVFAGEADYVISALPGLPELDGIFNAGFFARMKKSALFINVGRGNTVVQEDLAAALRAGELSGAVLDVSQPDPLPRLHPLRRCRRVFLSEHYACLSGDNEQRLRTYYLSQAKAFAKGELNDNG